MASIVQMRQAGFSRGGRGGAKPSLEERKGFAAITLGIYTLLSVCVFFTFKNKVSLDYPSNSVGSVLSVL